ncbi:hypothetical protein EXIGLDRAFT_732974 [Exidia glandulosa HHB12029]|uniref:C2H2-type domain-containing protein n=1 Tax=Exidia glandulosa HHB12029 TaxID=1314781 RepID=A0A165KLM4_EXIGL|nr:hypothetical protein EXIGLDRAFT_732974 [Exidia glandulosa HHB12029]
MASQTSTLYPRAQREGVAQPSRLSGMSRSSHSSTSTYRPEDPRRSQTPGYPQAPPLPRTDRNFLVPRTEAPRTTADPQSRMRELERHALLVASFNANAQHEQWQPQPAPSHSRQSSQSGYYHPATTLQTPFQHQHMGSTPIHRPSTAPPSQLRSVLAPPQSPDRYRTPRPRSPIDDNDYPEFFCKRCNNLAFREKQQFVEHLAYVHGIQRMARH